MASPGSSLWLLTGIQMLEKPYTTLRVFARSHIRTVTLKIQFSAWLRFTPTLVYEYAAQPLIQLWENNTPAPFTPEGSLPMLITILGLQLVSAALMLLISIGVCS